jgi:hypothetical protein
MIERLIEYISSHEGECWATMEQIDGEFRRMFPFSGTIRRHTAVYRPPLGSLPVRCCAPSVSPTEPVAGKQHEPERRTRSRYERCRGSAEPPSDGTGPKCRA